MIQRVTSAVLALVMFVSGFAPTVYAVDYPQPVPAANQQTAAYNKSSDTFSDNKLLSTKVEKNFEYSVEEGIATVTKYTGNAKNVTVPAKLGGYPVRVVASGVFYDNDTVESIVFSEGITVFESESIRGCGSLKSITYPSTFSPEGNSGVNAGLSCFPLECPALEEINIPSNNKYYKTVDGIVYTKDMKTLAKVPIAYKQSTVIIPEGVESIGNQSFLDCKAITKVVMPDTVKTIGYWAFDNCSELSEINISKNCEFIGQFALTSTKIKSVHLPATVNAIASSVFSHCNRLESITVDKNSPYYVVIDGALYSKDETGKPDALVAYPAIYPASGLKVVDGVKWIIQEAFCCALHLRYVELPASVSSIGHYAFMDCPNLTSVTFNGDAPEIGYIIFANDELTAYYPSGNKTWAQAKNQNWGGTITWKAICADSSKHNYSVTTTKATCTEAGVTTYKCTACGLTFSKTLNPKGHKVDKYVKNEEGINIGTCKTCKQPAVTVDNRDILAYSYCTDSVLWILYKDGELEFSGKGNIPDYELLPTGKPYTPWYEYDSGYFQIEKLTIKSGITGIGEYAFSNLYYFSQVNLPEAVTYIGDGAFRRCNGLESIVIPQNVTTIGWHAFDGCDKLESVTLPKNLQTIGFEAFYDCRALKKVYYKGSSSDWSKIYIAQGNECLKNADIVFVKNGPATIVTQPESVAAASGITAKVTVKATGDGLKYTWYYKDEGASKFTKTDSFKGASYAVTMNSSRNGRQVYCVITDKYGNKVQTDTVALFMKTELKITTQPESVTVASGSTAKVTVKATGEGLTYTWYYKEAGKSKFTKTDSFTGTSYSVKMTSARNGRQVYCVVTDRYGEKVTTDTVTLGMKVAAKITAQPVSVTAANGKTAKVTVKTVGDGLKYTWYYKDAGATAFKKTTSFKGASYSVAMTKARSGRQVYCVITDKYGNKVTTDIVALNIKVDSAKITTQPVSVTVANGKTAKVTVKASGSGLKYTWYYREAGATNFKKTTSFKGTTYSVKMTSARSGRQVYCVITDKYGNKVTTNVATLKMK